MWQSTGKDASNKQSLAPDLPKISSLVLLKLSAAPNQQTQQELDLIASPNNVKTTNQTVYKSSNWQNHDPQQGSTNLLSKHLNGKQKYQNHNSLDTKWHSYIVTADPDYEECQQQQHCAAIRPAIETKPYSGSLLPSA